ncbi:WD-repeat membrane protein, putative [Eimeria praecox]|uniref:WD-repeat membrane protein, putative n=1 Tax=Eimeria praecox TaxID=51316 RepID=U6GE54_9EIME|nr:WD-repeat membrane protein, putative [Eimeria praecox]
MVCSAVSEAASPNAAAAAAAAATTATATATETAAAAAATATAAATARSVCFEDDKEEEDISLSSLLDKQQETAGSILFTPGRDNALVEWIFDNPDGIPRELKSRRGNIGTVTHMEFYGPEAKQLLVATTQGGRGFLGYLGCLYGVFEG